MSICDIFATLCMKKLLALEDSFLRHFRHRILKMEEKTRERPARASRARARARTREGRRRAREARRRTSGPRSPTGVCPAVCRPVGGIGVSGVVKTLFLLGKNSKFGQGPDAGGCGFLTGAPRRTRANLLSPLGFWYCDHNPSRLTVARPAGGGGRAVPFPAKPADARSPAGHPRAGRPAPTRQRPALRDGGAIGAASRGVSSSWAWKVGG